MLTHTRGVLEPTGRPPQARREPGAGSATAHLAAIKRACLGVLAILLGGCVVAAIMALKIAIYLPRFIHH
jgi:hypothetical protein